MLKKRGIDVDDKVGEEKPKKYIKSGEPSKYKEKYSDRLESIKNSNNEASNKKSKQNYGSKNKHMKKKRK